QTSEDSAPRDDAPNQNDLARTIAGCDEPDDLPARVALEPKGRVLRPEEVTRDRREGGPSPGPSDGRRDELPVFDPDVEIVRQLVAPESPRVLGQVLHLLDG